MASLSCPPAFLASPSPSCLSGQSIPPRLPALALGLLYARKVSSDASLPPKKKAERKVESSSSTSSHISTKEEGDGEGELEVAGDGVVLDRELRNLRAQWDKAAEKKRAAGGGKKAVPWNYWSNIDHIVEAVRVTENFWSNFNISSRVVPNEMLLRLQDAHGLRHAIYRNGGRETVAYLLNVDCMPGDFTQAMKYQEVQQLVKMGVVAYYNQTDLTSYDQENLPRQILIGPEGGAMLLHPSLRYHPFPPQSTQFFADKKPKRTRWQRWEWSEIQEQVYAFNTEYTKRLKIPPIFCCRLTDLIMENQVRLNHAIRRYGTMDDVVEKLGFVPYSKWNYFCRFYFLVKDMQLYCDTVLDGRREVPPKVEELKGTKWNRLRLEIQKNGGKKIIASRLGLKLPGASRPPVNYGEFDLDFAVELMQFMLDECWKQRPEERAARHAPPYLFLPSDEEFMKAGRDDLRDKVYQYGGPEQVARRLQLGYKS